MATKSVGELRTEIAVVEARVRAEARRLEQIVGATRAALQRGITSRKGMSGIFLVALVAGLAGGFRTRARRRYR